MSDDDLIRRGDVLREIANEGLHILDAAIAALPARGVGVPADVRDYAIDVSEAFDTMMEVERNPAGAWQTIQALAGHLAAVAPTDAATQKGGDAHDRRLRSHEASPGVTAGADAAQAPAEDAHAKGETAGQMLERLGMDGVKWAAEFRTTALRLGYSDMDEGWLIGWFCNAIMAGYDRATTEAAHVNETLKSEHDGADVLTDAAQAREAALREAAAVADEHTFGGAAVRDAILALISEART